MKVKALKKRTQNIHISLFYCLHSTQTWAYNLKQISVCTPFPCFLRGRQCWKKKTSNILAAHTRTIIPTLSSASFSHVNIYALIWIRSRSTNCSFHPTSNFTSDGINLRVSPPTFRFFFFTAVTAPNLRFCPCEGAPRRGRSTAVLPLRSTGRAASSARIHSSFTCIRDFS